MLAKSQHDQGRNIRKLTTQMDYRNPTLTEILVELHLAEGTLPEKDFMTLVRELAAYGLDNLEFTQAVIVTRQDDEQESEPKLVPRIRCWDQERIKLVQISPDVVVVNIVGEYLGWEKFGEHVRTTCEAVAKALKSDFQPARVEFTTIDIWKADLAGFTIGQHLNCGGPIIPKWYSEVNVSVDISLGQGFYNKDGFNKRVKVRVRPTADSVEFQLVITFGKTNQEKNLTALMELLHRDSVQCFEEIITDKVRSEIMGGTQ